MSSCLAEDSYEPIKYGGPIVYSGGKPPIIHFPPHPRDVSKYQVLKKLVTKGHPR